VRTADRQGFSEEQEMKVAVPQQNPSYETFLNNFFPQWQIVYCPDGEAACQAVASGEADCGLVSSYRISRLSDQSKKYGLIPLATDKSMEMCFALRKGDGDLFSILNKVTHLMPEATMNASLTRYAFHDDEVSLVDFLRDNLGYVIAGIVTIIAIILLLVLRSARAEAKAKAGSQIISETELDRLTGLYNREFFLVYANRLYREHPEKPMDAVAVDIERFHSLTSLNGRTFGNEVLKTLGSEITAFLKENGGIGSRSENDHFDLYCAHRETYEDLLARFTERLNELSRNADIQLRMGVMPWQKELEPEQMLDRAWSAARSIRGHYKTHLMIYDEELRHQEEMNQRLRNDLTRALEEGEMEVWYQPKFDIRVDPPVMRSAEALVRWHHPRLGMITPDMFIPLFERSGQITALDSYVWAEAGRQIAVWREKYGRLLPISVNLSRVDVFDPNLMTTLEKIVKENRLDRSDLTLEITESAYTENADHLIRVIEDLRQKGYVIEMDDFGSGYSSLNMLSSLPVDVLKMDIAFIRNIERNEKDFHLVELILDIARYLKVPVVAEGVETEKQLKLLKEAGCDLVQGYYFSRPLPVEEFEERMFK
jgi:EAL domain-containing protein (putative c-di-GMP-specific phosphodiesterase class I)/GGDEF domain-containing protein